MVCPHCSCSELLTLSTSTTAPLLVTRQCSVCETRFAVEVRAPAEASVRGSAADDPPLRNARHGGSDRRRLPTKVTH
jgi:hypothetical protein